MSSSQDDLPPCTDVPANTGLQKIVSSLPVDHAGTTVYLQGWRLDNNLRPPVIIVHDLGEHAEIYAETAEQLARSGFTTYVFDLRGHGRSGRRLGHAPNFATLVRDLLQVAAWVRHKEGGQAPAIMGHGIGALVTMEFAERHGAFCRAAILSAPCIELIHDPSPVERFLIKLLTELHPTLRLPKMLAPRFLRDLLNLTTADISAFADASSARAEIPPFPRLTSVFAHELMAAIKRAETRFIEYPGSVLILCPGSDRIASYSRLKRAAALHIDHNIKLIELKGLGHSVFASEAARAEAMATVLPWLANIFAAPKVEPSVEPRVLGASRAPSRLESEKPGATRD